MTPHTARRWLVVLLGTGTALTAVAILLWLAWGVRANQPAASVTAQEAQLSVARARDWLRRHESEVLADGNVPLWLMVREAARLSGDAYLHDLYRRFYDIHMMHAGLAPERLILESDAGAPVDFSAVAGQPDYVQFFYYALSCDKAFGRTPGVVRGRSAGRCLPMAAATLLQPPCATHQLMGYMFMRQTHCEDPRLADAQIARLQNRIVAELRWDPRVIDPYVQRVLMLYWTGAAARVQPAWLRRVLDAQQPDGGWADQQEIARWTGDRWLGFGGYEQRFLSLHPVASSFHTTAQGLLLMSLVAHAPVAARGSPP